MIRWKLPPDRMKRAGITNAFQLARITGVGYPAASRLMATLTTSPGVERVDVRALEMVAKALGVKPLSLLEYVEQP